MRLSTTLTLVTVTLTLTLTLTLASRPPRWNELDASIPYHSFLQWYGPPHTRGGGGGGDKTDRAALFRAELASVLAHNRNPLHTYKQGLNAFSDLTPEEKAATLLTANAYWAEHAHTLRDEDPVGSWVRESKTTLKDGEGLDFRTFVPPVLTAVKDQGGCGSCWAHSIIESVETMHALNTGLLEVLSVEQVLTCVPNVTITSPKVVAKVYGGCNGYSPQLGLDWIANKQGGMLTSEWRLPYRAYFDLYPPPLHQDMPACTTDLPTGRAPVTGVTTLPSNNASAIIQALENGPVITVIWTPPSFLAYESGVFSSPECNGADNMLPTHAVVIVGWGVDPDSGLGYFVIRNTWTASWGDKGFIKMFRPAKETPQNCGLMLRPVGGITDWQNVTTCGTCGLEGWVSQALV